MPSMQNAAPGSKSMKFQDGLNNMFKPFLAQPGEELDGEQQALSKSLDQRLRLNPQVPAPNNFQPGLASQQQQQQQQQKAVPQQPSPVGVDQVPTPANNKTNTKDNDSDDDSDLDEYDDDDAALEAFRARRLAELKVAQKKQVAQQAPGLGEVRTITQDEFLPECTSAQWVVTHFFHKDFERCKLMDHHLKRIAPMHRTCKFVRIDAEKTPFFVGKLNIKTLPTLLVFRDGKTVDRLLGFDGLSDNKDPDNFTTSSLGRFLERSGCIEYEGPDSDDEIERNSSSRANVRKGLMQSRFSAYDEDI